LTGSLEIKNLDGNLILTNHLPLEEYLACVATSEMSSQCPDSYIEAQTIVARSWMLANVEQKHIDLGFDVCNDDCCQRFQGINNLTMQSRNAAKKTAGQVLMYDEKIVDARYSKSCGGIMEKFENLWENDPKPYMLNKSDAPVDFNVDLTDENQLKQWVDKVPVSFCSPHYIKEEELHKYLGNVDEQGKYFRWEIETTQEELVDNMKGKLGIDIELVLELTVLSRGGSGRILELQIDYIDSKDKSKILVIHKDYEVRRVLHKMFLYSSAISIEHIYEENRDIPAKFVFKGAGWGHGAGMCQIGGIGMSLAGYDADQIVMHYYSGSELRRIY
jgi:SpoIID/LytB domain protein